MLYGLFLIVLSAAIMAGLVVENIKELIKKELIKGGMYGESKDNRGKTK